MGVLEDLSSIDVKFNWITITLLIFAPFALLILLNVLHQLLFRNPNEPPIVFHLVPLIGNTLTYGIDPYAFFFACQKKYGNVFTFVLVGKKTTVCLGPKGNELILNGKVKDVNAEDIYGPLTTPVFGSDVVYDCPHSKLMEQKKFVKFGLTTSALNSYVELITQETRQYFSRDAPHKRFASTSGTVDIPPTLAQLTILTASRSLQGKEVRERIDSTFGELYHDLDKGFTPINFMFPWVPFPHNKKRDFANKKLTETYMSIIEQRWKGGSAKAEGKEEDMIWNLMNCKYKDGTPVPDHEIAHMMIALLMAGQHSSSSTIAWILLRLAGRPDVQEALLQEQKAVLGTNADGSIKDPRYDDFARLPLHTQVVKETLRLHAPIHSILRAVMQPMHVEGTPYTIPTSHTLLAAPGVNSRMPENFPEPLLWEPRRWDKTPSEEHARLSPAHLKEETAEEKEDYGYGMISKGASSPYLPFGAGRHRCIGEQFAYLQLQTIMTIVLRDFKFLNLDGSDKVVGTDYSSLFSKPLRPAVVRWERRDPGKA